MCHFHSVIVTADGRILHHPSNSHSAIAAHNSLDTGLDARWWEAEWDGRGWQPLPQYLIQTRGKTSVVTSAAYAAAENHYRKLVEILANPADDTTVFPSPFDQPEYSDVRDMAKRAYLERKAKAEREAAEAIQREQLAEAEAEAEAVAERFEAAFIGFTTDQEVAFVRHLIENSALSVSVEDVAAEEIEEAEQHATDGLFTQDDLDSEYQRGYESASEDMYTYDYMQEEIDSAVDRAKEQWEADELEAAKDEAYKAGFLAALSGATTAVTHINGMPSFLFTK